MIASITTNAMTRLLALENTIGGRVVPMSYINDASGNITIRAYDDGVADNSFTTIGNLVPSNGDSSHITISWKVGGSPQFSITVDGTTETASPGFTTDMGVTFSGLYLFGHNTALGAIDGRAEDVRIYTTVEAQ